MPDRREGGKLDATVGRVVGVWQEVEGMFQVFSLYLLRSLPVLACGRQRNVG